jgi:nucleotide-binding universal stress UspA family protein
MELKSLLAAVDFSPASLAALRRAQVLARGDGALRLFHVIGAYPSIYADRQSFERLYEDLERRALAKLGELADHARKAGVPNVELEVTIGRPAEEILSACSRFRPDGIVLGARARSVAGRLLLGSVSEDVARRSPVPVLVVRENVSEAPVERVLLAIDDDPSSLAASKAAATLARRLGVALEAVHVVEVPEPPPSVGPLPPYAGITREVLDDVRFALEERVALATGRPVPVHVLTGFAAREIVRQASARDVLVCGTHGRRALGRTIFGSVATKLLRRAPCPVLVVGPRSGEGVAERV